MRKDPQPHSGSYAPHYDDCIEGDPTCGCCERRLGELEEQFEVAQRELERWHTRFSEFSGPSAARAELDQLRSFRRAIERRTSTPASTPNEEKGGS